MTTITAPTLAADVPTNWGRWGMEDELGTLNFITEESRPPRVAEARTARVVSLAAPVTPVPAAGPVPFGTSPMPAGVLQIMNYTGSPAVAITDTLVINTHHGAMTHIDAVAHIPTGNQVYPGIDLDQTVVAGTVKHGSTSAFLGGIVTRGVLLDLAPDARLDEGHWITRAELEAAEARSDVRVESGDALVVHAGWPSASHLTGVVPAMTVDAVRWMAEREVSIYAGEIGDRPPFLLPPDAVLAMHQVALGKLGMPLIDCVEVAELTDVCRNLSRFSFLFIVAPMPVVGTTGLPVNPLAIF